MVSSPSPQPLFLLTSSAFQVAALHQQRKGKHWSTAEDSLLRQAVQTIGEHHWRLIATKVPGRTSAQCLHRWTKILKPGLIKGPWREDEDGKLREWVQKYGAKDWAKCAMGITGRNGKQCRERWSNALNPALKRGKWTAEEDRMIVDLYCKEGPKWSLISLKMAGRSENSIKNHFYSNLRKTFNGRSAYIAPSESLPLLLLSISAEFSQAFKAQALAAQSGLVVPVPQYALLH